MIDLSKYAGLRAPRGRVLVRLFPAEATTPSGLLHIPERAKNKRPRRGIVVAVGPQREAKLPPIKKVVHQSAITEEQRREIKAFLEWLQSGPTKLVPLQSEHVEVKQVDPIYLPRLVEIGEEVLVAQWTVSTGGKSGHVKEATFHLEDGEELVIVDEAKDVYAVIERDGPEDKAVVE